MSDTPTNIDDSLKIPQRHIPARFVTLIPPEFPLAMVVKDKKQKNKSIKQMKEQGVGIRKIAKNLSVGVGTIYKVLKEAA